METQLGIDENDVFYMDLRRQMLLLTSDDGDEEEEEEEEKSFMPRTSVFANSISPATSLSQASWSWRNQYVDLMLFMQVNVQKSNNGTGVFIPQIMSHNSMRKHKGGRKKCRRSQNSEKRKIQQVGGSGK